MSFIVRFATLMSIVLTFSLSSLFAVENNQWEKWPRNYLKVGEFLKDDQYMVSKNRAFFAILQKDGKLEVYKGASPTDHIGVFWSLNRTDKVGDYFAVLQPDGNFAIYKGTGPSDSRGYLWDTHITATGGEFFLVMQDDGNLAEYKGRGPDEDQGAYIWSIRQSVSRITWLPDGKSLHSGSGFGLSWVYYEQNNYKTGIDIWMGRSDQSLKWVLKDGMFILAKNSDQCLDINTKYAKDDRRYLKLVACDKNSATQKGWKYSKEDRRILNSVYPQGCLLATDQFGAGWIHPRMATDGCPRYSNIDLWDF